MYRVLERNEYKIGFTAGAMDLLHAGHILMLKEIKEELGKLSDCGSGHLVVALQSDPTIDRPEKHKPIETLEERKIRLEACKYVDEIHIYNTEEELYNLLQKLDIDIRFMGADWKDKPNYSRDLLPDMKVIYNTRDHNYSSSNLRERIKNAES